MTRFINICSSKGGVGKTTTAINLCSAFRLFNKDAVLVDCNLTAPNVGIYLGSPVVPVTLHHVLSGKNTIHEAVYVHKNMKVVFGGLFINDLYKARPEKLKHALLDLDGFADIILLDSPPGLGREAVTAMELADEVLIVTNPELPAVTDALKTARLAEHLRKHILGIVVTRSGRLDLSVRNIEQMIEHPVIAIIPDDPCVKMSVVNKLQLVDTYPRSDAAVAYKKLAAALIGRHYEEEREKNLLETFLSFFRFKK